MKGILTLMLVCLTEIGDSSNDNMIYTGNFRWNMVEQTSTLGKLDSQAVGEDSWVLVAVIRFYCKLYIFSLFFSFLFGYLSKHLEKVNLRQICFKFYLKINMLLKNSINIVIIRMFCSWQQSSVQKFGLE